jgi:hypothetical protein
MGFHVTSAFRRPTWDQAGARLKAGATWTHAEFLHRFLRLFGFELLQRLKKSKENRLKPVLLLFPGVFFQFL